MKLVAGFILAISTASVQPAAFAQPTPVATASTMTPPTGEYENLTATSDKSGAYRLGFRVLTKPEDNFKHLVYWIRVSRFEKAGDPKSAYPSQYLLFKIDCPSQTYVLAARFDVDRDGKDIGPSPHTFANPVRKKLPGSKGGPHINFYNSPPELVAAAQLQQACFPGE